MYFVEQHILLPNGETPKPIVQFLEQNWSFDSINIRNIASLAKSKSNEHSFVRKGNSSLTFGQIFITIRWEQFLVVMLLCHDMHVLRRIYLFELSNNLSSTDPFTYLIIRLIFHLFLDSIQIKFNKNQIFLLLHWNNSKSWRISYLLVQTIYNYINVLK